MYTYVYIRFFHPYENAPFIGAFFQISLANSSRIIREGCLSCPEDYPKPGKNYRGTAREFVGLPRSADNRTKEKYCGRVTRREQWRTHYSARTHSVPQSLLCRTRRQRGNTEHPGKRDQSAPSEMILYFLTCMCLEKKNNT